uniref:Uncharacterized protein n=1 Tax=Anguilla anguilla TaxID=7936 RepID=A0A0E9UTB8_ANGAN
MLCLIKALLPIGCHMVTQYLSSGDVFSGSISHGL